MEEDAGKLNHSGATISTSDFSSVDYNRAGVPLLEIVSEPDMRSAEEARAYMEQLKAVLEYIDVCDCKMQEGSLRCDANISIMPEGAKEFGTRAEIKNLNSFRALVRAIEYEVERQKAILEDGGHVVQETRTWDEANGVTLSMRSRKKHTITVTSLNLTLYLLKLTTPGLNAYAANCRNCRHSVCSALLKNTVCRSTTLP